MNTITPSLEHLYKMLSASSDQPRETKFGELLVKIIKKPYIPANKDSLIHPNPTLSKPGQPNRLQKSRLSNSDFAEVRAKWNEIIVERNRYPDSHGLSYDLFMKMIRDLYGCGDVRDPEMPITREAVNHLVHTANPWIKSKSAATLQEFNLMFISCFTQDYTFEYLKEVGDQVIAEYNERRRQMQAIKPVKLNLDFSAINTEEELKEEEELFLGHKGKITNDAHKANNLRTLLFNKLQEKGSYYFISSGLPLDEILAMLADENPKFSKETFICLPQLLEISLEDFMRLLTKDKSDLDVGF